MTQDPKTVLSFWFEDISPEQWWTKDPGFDKLIESKFGTLHASAIKCELWEWRGSAVGRLAEIIVLDQFSRNIFRDKPKAFESDPLALVLAQEGVRARADEKLTPSQKSFLYMPYMHSESRAVHEVAIRLYSQPGLEFNLKYEQMHKAIVDRFGRYPHRNAILGRISSEEEIEFLKGPGSSF
ncbi:MAG: DUF924 family protein [Oligoflexales bacterium]